jgi:hypothetical protein
MGISDLIMLVLLFLRVGPWRNLVLPYRVLEGMSQSVFGRPYDGSRPLLHGPATQALRTSGLCGDDTFRRISCSNNESQLMFPRMPSGKQLHVKVFITKYREASEQVATDATGMVQHMAY